jgi:hypothetical protein
MTPKEKAEELIDKMLTNNGDEHHHCTYYVAKQCALIAVDEILSLLWSVKTDVKYFSKVKEEIEKL